jgi:hypothetical protein
MVKEKNMLVIAKVPALSRMEEIDLLNICMYIVGKCQV